MADVRRVEVGLGDRSYPVAIGAGLLGEPAWFQPFGRRPLRVVTDANVAPLYLKTLFAACGAQATDALTLPAGEPQKTLATLERIIDWLLAARFPRDGVLVALGGGVVGDLTGFAAAVYQRGIDFVQIPTTLLAQVDSSVGGKTGVNHARGKNLVGAFHQPRAVICDLATLRTLPPRELRAGLAEVSKYRMLGDAAFFGWLEAQLDALLALAPGPLGEAVEACCRMKAALVGADEREQQAGAGGRALLNLGHTFAHAIETHVRYEGWLHGEAVAVGLLMAADLSQRHGWIDAADVDRCRRLIERAGLPSAPPRGLEPREFRALLTHDKKVAGGKLRLVLLRRLGEAFVTSDFDEQKLAETLAAFCSAATAPRSAHR